MGDEYLRADPRRRRNAVRLIGAVIVFGCLVLGFGLPAAIRAANASVYPRRWLCLGFITVVGLLVIPVLFAARGNMKRGLASIDTQQFPAPGTPVLRDTRILRGPAATAFGKVQLALGTILGVAGLALGAISAYAMWLLW